MDISTHILYRQCCTIKQQRLLDITDILAITPFAQTFSTRPGQDILHVQPNSEFPQEYSFMPFCCRTGTTTRFI